MNITKLIRVLKEDAKRQQMALSTELLKDASFNLQRYLKSAFSVRFSRCAPGTQGGYLVPKNFCADIAAATRKLQRGNCYVTTEALFHLLGGKAAGWKPMRMRWQRDTHWFLRNTKTGQIVDATAQQFTKTPDYRKAVGSGFLTKRPSKRAQQMMRILLWQNR